MKGLPGLVVEEDSATMGLPNEIPIPIEADHSSMTRFSSMKSERFRMVLDCIKEMVEDSLGVSQSTEPAVRDQFLRALKSIDPEEVLRNVPRPSPGTCAWIVDTEQFSDWRDRSDARVLWISGTPGGGKTTTARFLIEHLRRWLQRNRKAGNKDAIASFFFCSSKQWLRDSEIELVKSLLYQTLTHSKHLFRYLPESDLEGYVAAAKRSEIADERSEDRIDFLWKLLTVVVQRGIDVSFWILIDGLDELQERSRERLLVRIRLLMSQDLGQKLKFVLLDRSPPSARGITASMTWIDIRRQQQVTDDVRRSINSQIADLCSSEVIPWQYQNLIEEALVEVADGNFLQAALAWKHFRADVSYWSPQVIKSRLAGLQQLSGEAKTFYCSLLERIPEDRQEIAKIGFIWVLGSRKPLSLTELQHAVAISADQTSWAELQESLGFNFDAHFDEVFGYLLRVDPDLRVRFAHTTVKELLTSPAPTENESSVLSKFRIGASDADVELAKRCITVLSFRDFVKLRDIAREAMADRIKDFFVNELQSEEALQSLIFSKYDDPDSVHDEDQQTSQRVEQVIRKLDHTELDERTRSLFGYCVSYWHYHCNKGSSDAGVRGLLKRFALLRQSHYFLMVAMLLGMARFHRGTFWNDIDQFSRLPPLQFVVRAGDHPAVLQDLMDGGQDLNAEDCHGWTPLIWVLLEDREQSLEVLLAHQKTKFGPSEPGSDHALHVALKAGVSIRLVLRLLADPRVEINAKGSDKWTALQWCLSRPKLRPLTCELLRRKDVDIYDRNAVGLNAIEQIYQEGLSEESALAIIARSDVPANWFEKPLQTPAIWTSSLADDQTPATYLYRASALGWTQVTDRILESEPFKAFSADLDGFNLLERYAYHGLEAKLSQRLAKLNPELNPDLLATMRDNGARLLLLCVQQDWEQIANLLIVKYGANADTADRDRRTILHWASELQWKSITTLVLTKSQNWLDRVDCRGRTALHVAAEHRNESAVRALLQAGANSLLRDRLDRLPIHLAAEQGHRDIVILFLSHIPIKALSTSDLVSQGRGLMHYLVMWHSDSFIRQCLSILKPQIDMEDDRGRTPLHYASIFGNSAAVGVLLEIGADPNKTDSSASTACHYALRHGSMECVQALLRHGVETQVLDRFGRNIVLLAVRGEDFRTVEYVARYIQARYSSREIAKHASHLDCFGRSALHYLCYWAERSEIGYDDTGAVVLGEIADDESESTNGLAKDMSPVERLVNIFAHFGAPINGRDCKGYTPLDTAAMFGNIKAASALLRLQKPPKYGDGHNGVTSLDLAVVNGHGRIAELIRAAGVQHSLGWQEKITPLYRPWQTVFQKGEQVDEGPLELFVGQVPSSTDSSVEGSPVA
jgi:ankyrin repeat protein